MTKARVRRGSSARRSPGARSTSAPSAAASSMRASGAPMQTWMPPPKPMCSAAFSRETSKAIGVVEHPRVAVRRAEQQRHLLDRAAPARRRSRRRPRAPSARRAGAGGPSGSAPRPRPPADLARREAAPTAPGGGAARSTPLPSVFTVASWPALRRTMIVETSSGSLSRPTVDPRLDQARDEVVPRLAPPLLDEREHVVAELRGGRVAASAWASVVSSSYIFTVAVRPVEQVARAVGGTPSSRQIDGDRVRLGVVAQELEVRSAGEQLAGEVLARAPQRLDRTRRERRRDELPDPRVLGRLEPEQAPALRRPRTPASARRAAPRRRTRPRCRRAGSCVPAAGRAGMRARRRAA